jgi:cytosine/adenosine deaminase-related metal-dependent hydrolase
MLDSERAITLNAGLGTDGMQSNMLKEAKEGTLIRSASINAGEPSLDYLTLLFEHNPTIASGIFNRPLGRVEPGYRADLAIYDYLPRTEITPDNLGSHLLFGFPQPSEVYTSGELRVSEGQMTQLDEQQIKADALIQSNRLWKQLL